MASLTAVRLAWFQRDVDEAEVEPRRRRRRRRPATPVVPPSERSAASRALVIIGASVMVPGLLLVSFVGFLAIGSHLQASRAQRLLDGTFRAELKNAVAPVSGIIPEGKPVAVLQIPALHLRQVVVEGSSSRDTMQGPGLARDTALPGQAGVSLVIGRRATYGAPFAHLGDLRPGDQMTVTTGQGTTTYVVDVVRTSDAHAQKVAVAASRLTLVTSDPSLVPDRSLLVSGVIQGKPKPGAITPVDDPADAAGKHTTDGAIELLLWAQLLVIVAVAATFAALRFPRRVVWLGAVPVLLAVLWHVFENISLLLPNTL